MPALQKPLRRAAICAALQCLIGLTAAGFAPTVSAQSIDLQGILPGGKAVISIAGGAPKIVQAGANLNGSQLLSVDSNSILVEEGGKKTRIELGAGPLRLQATGGGATANSGGKVVLSADSRGHYITTGFVNNKPQQFLVDTGASIVAVSKADAQRLGLNLANGRTVQANTANGLAYGTAIKVTSLRIGDITLDNVETWVLDDLAGPALLGMSFLSRTAMQQEGGRLTLVKRY